MKKLLSAVCVSLLGLSLASVANAQDKIVLKLGWVTSDAADDPYAMGARAFKDAIGPRSNGRIDVQFYPNRQLGDEIRLLEGIRFGTVDAGVIINSVVGQLEPAYQVHELPFVYATSEDAQRVFDGPIGAKMAGRLRDKNVVMLGTIEGGYRVMMNNMRPLTKPTDMHGIKWRVMQNPIFVDMFGLFGGNPIPMPIGETFIAVQQGTVGGIDIAAPFIEPNKWHEVFKYVSNTNHTYSAAHILMSRRAFDRLPKDLQEAVVDAGRTATKKQREEYTKLLAVTYDSLRAKGMIVNEVPDVGAWRTTVAPLYDKFRSTVGADIMDEVLAAAKAK